MNGHFNTLNVNTSKDKTDKWGLILKTLDDTDIGADRLTVTAGGFSGWHSHPAPVFVTVFSRGASFGTTAPIRFAQEIPTALGSLSSRTLTSLIM